MTLAEARRIARIIGTADHGCSTCVGNLAARLNDADLGFRFESTGKNLYARGPLDEREADGLYVRVTAADD